MTQIHYAPRRRKFRRRARHSNCQSHDYRIRGRYDVARLERSLVRRPWMPTVSKSVLREQCERATAEFAQKHEVRP